MTIIFGKDDCPYTIAAREEYARRGPVEYVNVIRDKEGMSRMLVHSNGKRRVPVIVDGDRVQIGFGGT